MSLQGKEVVQHLACAYRRTCACGQYSLSRCAVPFHMDPFISNMELVKCLLAFQLLDRARAHVGLGLVSYRKRLTPRHLAATKVPRNANFAKLKAGYLFPEVCAQSACAHCSVAPSVVYRSSVRTLTV
jgi:hypothetical protein